MEINPAKLNVSQKIFDINPLVVVHTIYGSFITLLLARVKLNDIFYPFDRALISSV